MAHIKFSKVILHNFLSFGHSEIDLTNKRYCLVSGINNDKKDNATSNGAGKSTFGSAICFALTGETISGNRTNLKNINVSESEDMYVELHFEVDDVEYKITRYKNPKPDLKIIIDDKDVSGKGIRESEAILSKYLPDLTSQLIGSIIILGQGLPYKFSNNTPSGRKEILEKLSKSDFMIQDLKDRINERLKILNQTLREIEDKILADSSNKALLLKQITEQEEIIKTLQQPRDFDSEINYYTTQLTTANNELQKIKEQLNKNDLKNAEENNLLANRVADKTTAVDAENIEFNNFKLAYYEKKSNLNAAITTVKTKINNILAIKDICPTCGQHIPNVIKPSIENEQKELTELQKQLEEVTTKYLSFEKIHNNELHQVEQLYNADISEISNEIRIIKQQTEFLRKQETEYNQTVITISTQINKINLEKNQFIENVKIADSVLHNLQTSVEKLDKELLYNNSGKESVSKHISVLNQMNTLIKRDFRGYLLSNVISFIASKIKEYSFEIFGTDLLTFTLDGNNIDISYCGKPFENLSGGERQRTDLIIQFAIRDMMRQYLNFSSNILLLDEIFDALDATAVDAVLRCICNKLVDVDSLFIISHHARELEIPYDSELVVIKNEHGISNINWR